MSESRDEEWLEVRANFLWGVIWITIGAVVTAVTYAAADPGGTYVLFWGPVVYGGWKVIKGGVMAAMLWVSSGRDVTTSQ